MKNAVNGDVHFHPFKQSKKCSAKGYSQAVMDGCW